MSTKVVVKPGQSVEEALKVFRRLLQRDETFKEVKKRSHFMTRAKKLEAKKTRVR